MSDIEKLTRDQSMIFIDVSDGTSEPTWARIGYSEVFEEEANAETTERSFIMYRDNVEEVDRYKFAQEQEIMTYKGDPAFDFIYDIYKKRKICKVKLLRVFAGNVGTEEAPKFDAWLANSSSIILGGYNAQDSKITYTLSYGADILDGIVTTTGTGSNVTPVFSPAA